MLLEPMLECGAARLHILLDSFALAQGDMTSADVAGYPFASEQPSTVLLALDMLLGPPLLHPLRVRKHWPMLARAQPPKIAFIYS